MCFGGERIRREEATLYLLSDFRRALLTKRPAEIRKLRALPRVRVPHVMVPVDDVKGQACQAALYSAEDVLYH